MRLAIVSDIHDNIWTLRAALSFAKEADALLCCGDMCSPFIVGLMARDFPAGRIELVCGNNDGDLMRITQNVAKHAGRVRLHGEFAELPAEEYGLRIAMNHYPEIAQRVAAGGDYDLVCYGHDHRLAVGSSPASGTAVVNPGTLMGYDPIAGAETPATFVIYDTDAKRPDTYVVRPGAGQFCVERLER